MRRLTRLSDGQRLALVGFVPAIDLGDLDQMRSNRLAEVPEQ